MLEPMPEPDDAVMTDPYGAVDDDPYGFFAAAEAGCNKTINHSCHMLGGGS